MSVSEFRKLFSEMAVRFGWVSSTGGWTFPRHDDDECIIAIEMQRSSHSKLFYIGINLYIDGLFGVTIGTDVKINEVQGNVYRRQPKEFESFFDLTSKVSNAQREEGLIQFFNWLRGFCEVARTRLGILSLERAGQILIISSVREEIHSLS